MNGWAIGEEREYKDAETQDAADAHSLYTVLEEEIVPEYYDAIVTSGPRSATWRSAWAQRMRRAIATCGPRFSMRRMLADYTADYYVPAMNSNRAYRQNGGELAQRISQWKRAVREAWPSVGITLGAGPPSQAEVGDHVGFVAQVRPGRLSVDDLAIEIVVGKGGEDGIPLVSRTIPMRVRSDDEWDHQDGHTVSAQGTFVPDDTGKFSFGVRARPHHPALIHPLEMGLSTWA